MSLFGDFVCLQAGLDDCATIGVLKIAVFRAWLSHDKRLRPGQSFVRRTPLFLRLCPSVALLRSTGLCVAVSGRHRWWRWHVLNGIANGLLILSHFWLFLPF